LTIVKKDLSKGGCVIDWHACDVFPKKYIDLVVVLRTDSKTLYDRLSSRDYPEAKLQENLDSEIMDILLLEALEAFDNDIVVELPSVTNIDRDTNVARIRAWIVQWRLDNRSHHQS
jgi:adenylate kinase